MSKVNSDNSFEQRAAKVKVRLVWLIIPKNKSPVAPCVPQHRLLSAETLTQYTPKEMIYDGGMMGLFVPPVVCVSDTFRYIFCHFKTS